MASNSDLLARRNAAVPRGVATATPVFAARAENSEIWDVEGKRYIDFGGGIAVVNTGHRHPKVIAAVKEQIDLYTHTAFQVLAYEPYIELAERLNAMVPIKGPAKTIFLTTGAEAVENTVKIARAATGRPAVIAFTGGFHGRTLLATAMTGKVLPFKKAFGPLPSEVFHVPFPIEHYGTTVEDSLKALNYLFRADVEPTRVACIIVEPVQGEGGFHKAPPDLMRALRKICDDNGILLVADEIQSGFGRTGKMFACEHWGVEPDLITVAKSLAGGFPLSGVVGRADVMDAAEPGGLGGTYSGSPVACAAALAVLGIFEEEKLLDRANVIGARVKARLAEIAQRNDTMPVAAIRGDGAMIGFDIVKARGGHEPDPDGVKRLTTQALANGLVLLSCGIYGETIRLLMPLTISDAILNEGLDKLSQALTQDG
jgi:4-aminobutyrate aminotransferase/(S)-3-amino-2-methylpropionate transaminase